MRKVLKVSQSGYYAWIKRSYKPSTKHLRDANLIQLITEFHSRSQKVYGDRKVTQALCQKGYHVNHKCVWRLMK